MILSALDEYLHCIFLSRIDHWTRPWVVNILANVETMTVLFMFVGHPNNHDSMKVNVIFIDDKQIQGIFDCRVNFYPWESFGTFGIV